MRLVFILSLAAGLLFSCTENHNSDAMHKETYTALALNGDERWQADKATNENIAQLQQLMQEHLSQPDKSSLEAVNELGHVLQLGFDELFNECRMKGPEHNMLHVYLMPMLDDVKAMQQPDVATATAARDHLAECLGQYQVYFK